MRLLIFGACGRMGSEVAVLASAQNVEAVGFDVSTGPAALPLVSSPEEAHADVAVDFSSPEGARRAVACCLRCGIPLVEGTTGLTEAIKEEMQRAAQSIPILAAENFSLGVFVMKRLARTASELLKGFDIDIVERHRKGKRDAPSGTAKELGRVMMERGAEVQIASVRGGNTAGEHTVTFAGEDETVTLSHIARSRRVFAAGALEAAQWLLGRPAGLYGMEDLCRDFSTCFAWSK